MLSAIRPLLLAALTACAIQPSPSPSAATPRATLEASASAPPVESPSAAIALPAPGRPYDAAQVLEAMRASRRPGGVPDQLETDAIAAAVADVIWTFDATAWPELVAGGSCGPQACTLEVAGTPPGALGADLYVFTVTPAEAAVDVADATLRGLPTNLLAQLDAAARASGSAQLSGLQLLSARWLPPPETAWFVLAYRTGGEEGSCGIDVILDATSGRIVEQADRNC